jgi:hypothetical protein
MTLPLVVAEVPAGGATRLGTPLDLLLALQLQPLLDGLPGGEEGPPLPTPPAAAHTATTSSNTAAVSAISSTAVAGCGERGRLLPPGHGTTLHDPGCGCPLEAWLGWKQRAAQVVDSLVQRAYTMYKARELAANRALRVAYMLPHHK